MVIVEVASLTNHPNRWPSSNIDPLHSIAADYDLHCLNYSFPFASCLLLMVVPAYPSPSVEMTFVQWYLLTSTQLNRRYQRHLQFCQQLFHQCWKTSVIDLARAVAQPTMMR